MFHVLHSHEFVVFTTYQVLGRGNATQTRIRVCIKAKGPGRNHNSCMQPVHHWVNESGNNSKAPGGGRRFLELKACFDTVRKWQMSDKFGSCTFQRNSSTSLQHWSYVCIQLVAGLIKLLFIYLCVQFGIALNMIRSDWKQTSANLMLSLNLVKFRANKLKIQVRAFAMFYCTRWLITSENTISTLFVLILSGSI